MYGYGSASIADPAGQSSSCTEEGANAYYTASADPDHHGYQYGASADPVHTSYYGQVYTPIADPAATYTNYYGHAYNPIADPAATSTECDEEDPTAIAVYHRYQTYEPIADSVSTSECDEEYSTTTVGYYSHPTYAPVAEAADTTTCTTEKATAEAHAYVTYTVTEQPEETSTCTEEATVKPVHVAPVQTNAASPATVTLYNLETLTIYSTKTECDEAPTNVAAAAAAESTEPCTTTSAKAAAAEPTEPCTTTDAAVYPVETVTYYDPHGYVHEVVTVTATYTGAEEPYETSTAVVDPVYSSCCSTWTVSAAGYGYAASVTTSCSVDPSWTSTASGAYVTSYAA